MVARKLFVEGGGEARPLEDECRKGFREFLEKAGCGGKMPRIVACGGRAQAVDRFRSEIKNGESSCEAFLLVDSECPVDAAHDISGEVDGNPWGHLARPEAGGFDSPVRGAGQCHLMVECMESWFLADLAGLQKGLGKEFEPIRIPRDGQIEKLSKNIVMGLVDKAAGGRYAKGRHSFRILQALDPKRVMALSPWAKRFVDALLK